MVQKVVAFIFFIFHNRAAAEVIGIGGAGIAVTSLEVLDRGLKIILTLATLTILVLKYRNDKKKEGNK